MPKGKGTYGKKRGRPKKKSKKKGGWIQKALKPRMTKKGRRGAGTFRAEASARGMGTFQLMNKVLKHPTSYSKLTRQRARLMKTLTSFRR